MSTTRTPATYRVVAPLIQVGHTYKPPKNTAIERTFRVGDILPAWVPHDELERLSSEGFIEPVGA
jgi:hypothetical protein